MSIDFLLEESKYDFVESARKLIKLSFNVGIVVNENKTKYLMITRNIKVKGTFFVEGLIFELIKDLKYLGVKINEKDNMYGEIRMILNSENRCYNNCS